MASNPPEPPVEKTVDNRQYVDLLNSWAAEKAKEKHVGNSEELLKVWRELSCHELYLVLSEAQQTRVIAYKAMNAYYKEFQDVQNGDRFLNMCEKALCAFNDINLDIRLLQTLPQLETCRALINSLQSKEKEKFTVLLNSYRSSIASISAGGDVSAGYNTSIRKQVADIEESITEIMYELQSLCQA